MNRCRTLAAVLGSWVVADRRPPSPRRSLAARALVEVGAWFLFGVVVALELKDTARRLVGLSLPTRRKPREKM